MARHDIGDIIRLLDKENLGNLAKITACEPWNVLGMEVKAYKVEAVDIEEPLVYDGNIVKEMIFLDGLFEAV